MATRRSRRFRKQKTRGRKTRGRKTRGRKTRDRKTVRGRRQSTAGKILPPIDVRSENMLHEIKKRITKGPITIILVYADWCGHCHHLMPHFDQAAKSAQRSAQVIKIPDYMVPPANLYIKQNISEMASPIEPEGYPHGLTADRNGKTITEFTPVPKTPVLVDLMNQSGHLASEAGLNQEPNEMSINRSAKRTEVANEIAEQSLKNESMNLNVANEKPMVKPMVKPMANAKPIPDFVEKVGAKKNAPIAISNQIMKETSFQKQITEEEPSTVLPPLSDEDMMDQSITELSPANKLRGGSLYSSMARTAYTLAPTAALLASAALVFKSRKNRHNKRQSRRK